MTSKVINFEFPSSGTKVAVRGVVLSSLMVSLSKQYPAPSPPTVRVNYGTDSNPDYRLEVNRSDPDYITRVLPEYEAKIGAKQLNLVLRRGVVKRKLTEEELVLVADVREDLQEEGIELEKSDWMVFLKNVAPNGDPELKLLMEAIKLAGDPSSGVEADQDSFRRDV